MDTQRFNERSQDLLKAVERLVEACAQPDQPYL
jgi:hypothetical protein